MNFLKESPLHTRYQSIDTLRKKGLDHEVGESEKKSEQVSQSTQDILDNISSKNA